MKTKTMRYMGYPVLMQQKCDAEGLWFSSVRFPQNG